MSAQSFGESVRLLPFSVILLAMSAFPHASSATEAVDAPQLSVRTHFCYGVLGPPRSNQFLVGDILHVRYEVTGISTESPEHRADLAVVVQVVDKQGQVLFELPENVTSGDLVLGGSTLTSGCMLHLSHLEPGSYQVRVKVNDRLSETWAQADKVFEILPEKTFGPLNVAYAQDAKRRIYSNGYFTTGEVSFIHADVVGFEGQEGAPNVRLTVDVLDEKATLIHTMVKVFDAPLARSRFSEMPLASFPIYVQIPATRPGKFRVRLKLEDPFSQKSAEHELPLIIADPFSLKPGPQAP